MKYAIHPDFKSISRIPAFRTRLGISFVRHRYKGLFEYEHDIPGVKVRRLNISAESSPTGFVRSVLYIPEVLKSNTKVLFCHGGALVLPALPFCEDNCKRAWLHSTNYEFSGNFTQPLSAEIGVSVIIVEAFNREYDPRGIFC